MSDRYASSEIGKFTLTLEIECRSGLHAGARLDESFARGVDSPTKRNHMLPDSPPFFQASGFKGKLRALLESFYGLEVTETQGVSRHECKDAVKALGCKVCYGFGHSNFKGALQFCDLTKSESSLGQCEIKAENTMTRFPLSARPRSLERLAAGNVLKTKIKGSVHRTEIDNAYDMLDHLIVGLRLLEDDTLGGHGTRGYGWISFKNIKLDLIRFGGVSEEGLATHRHDFRDENLIALQKYLKKKLAKKWRPYFERGKLL